MKLKTILVGSTLAFAASSALAVNVEFAPPDFVWFHPSGGATPNHIWVAGDYWGQQFTGTGLASATHIDLTLDYDDNILSQTLDMEVLLNGSTVGTFDINPGDIGSHTYPFDFSSVAGPDYLLQVEATNTIDGGNGSVSIVTGDGLSVATLTDVPEASTWMAGAIVVGLAGLRLWSRRKV